MKRQTTTLPTRHCQRCYRELTGVETSKCDACKTADERRVYGSSDLSRSWHILTSFDCIDQSGQRYMLAACGTSLRISSLYPGWPKQVTGLKELARQYPSALVCRACSDNAPLP